MGLDEIVERLMGAVIVIGAAIAVVPLLLNMLAGQSGIDPFAGVMVFIAIIVIAVAGFVYIFRDKKYS
jgi:uncharacterized membrane protein